MLIGINANLVLVKGKPASRLAAEYYEAVLAAGGTPVILPSSPNPALVKSLLKQLDGLLISGAADLHPRLYGESLHPRTKPILPAKQQFDLQLIQQAWQQRIPTLAICYGIQLLNVARGGTLFQDIQTQLRLPSHRDRRHTVYLSEVSRLYQIIRMPSLTTNSFHHQSIKEVGQGLCINARSADGVIEGVEAVDPSRFFIGVQWHPERMRERPEMRRLFRALIVASQNKPR